MKKWLLAITIVCLTLSLAACNSKTQSDLNHFEKAKHEVDKEEKHVKQVMDDIHLNRLSELSKSDLTDRNKTDFQQMEKDIDKKLMPAFKSYKKAAKQLPAETKKVKQLRHTYLHEVDQQEKALKDIRSFVHLFNQSIKANEDILNYTRLFEKNRALLEKQVTEARQNGETESIDKFTSKLKHHNKELQKIAKKYLDADNPQNTKTVIKEKIQPLISKQIEELNQASVSEEKTAKAHQTAIEMYYSLQNYYETRQRTIDISRKLEQYDMNKTPLTGNELDKYHHQFRNDFKGLKNDVHQND